MAFAWPDMSETHNTGMSISACGDDALQVSGGEIKDLRDLGHQLRDLERFEEVVDGISSLTVQFDPSLMTMREAESEVQAAINEPIRCFNAESGLISLEVRFGGEFGPDLESISSALGRSEADIVNEICSLELCVDMLGFTPGFAYIDGLPDSLSITRRTTPRQRVAAGSIGIAAGRLGTYALEGPGGWQIVGRSVTKLFDPESDPPFLIRPGMRIQLNQTDQ